DEGLIRSIGVSNFRPEHIDRREAETGQLPAVNQSEVHLEWTQPEQRAYDELRGIVTESWSPLRRAGSVLDSEAINEIAAALDKTTAQVALRWHIQIGAVPIPFSSNERRIEQNFDVFSFELSTAELAS